MDNSRKFRLLLASLALDQVTPTTSEGWWEEEDRDPVTPPTNTDQQLSNVELQELCEHINDRCDLHLQNSSLQKYI